MKLKTAIGTAIALAGLTACNVSVKEDNSAQSNTDSAQPANNASGNEAAQQVAVDPRIQRMRDEGRTQVRDLRVLVDISDRKLGIFQGGRLVATHDVAVGSSEWPTPTGSWAFHRVDINPEWIPPEEEWAEDEKRAEPGAPDNPMGRARLVYRMPNTVHGTDDMESLGKAVSHGSIRVANPVALDLAQMLLKAGGAWEGDQWFRQMTENRSREYQVNLPDQVPITVRE